MFYRFALLPFSAAYLLAISAAASRQRSSLWRSSSAKSVVSRVHRQPTGPTHVVYNIGSNNDPPTPFNDTLIVAVEPLREVAAKIEYNPNRFVVTAAVSDHYGMATFNHFDVSSSLLEPQNPSDGWTSNGRHGERVVVPLVPLSAVLDSFDEFECSLIKTDMQGMDFYAVKGAGNDIARCGYIFSETYCNNFTNYKGAENDFHKHWLPRMTRLGFKPLTFCGDVVDEVNILWQNTRHKDNKPIPSAVCPGCYTDIVFCKDTSCNTVDKKSNCDCKNGHPPTW